MADLARHYDVFNTEEYTQFKKLFLDFSELCEEFQILSRLTEDSLAQFERAAADQWNEHRELEEYFRRLQVPMLNALIRTNLHLLGIWEDRLHHGEGLPYGSREVFVETIRVVQNARSELLRPRYVALLDEMALKDADRADRLLRSLMAQAPQFADFSSDKLSDNAPPAPDSSEASIFSPQPPSSLLSPFT
ncbi:hypothetical protein [Telmatospirillum siberiense]|nr:hypothetical protein [Telmatospirillum siberiense]